MTPSEQDRIMDVISVFGICSEETEDVLKNYKRKTKMSIGNLPKVFLSMLHWIHIK